jgi:hypothetical protein
MTYGGNHGVSGGRVPPVTSHEAEARRYGTMILPLRQGESMSGHKLTETMKTNHTGWRLFVAVTAVFYPVRTIL